MSEINVTPFVDVVLVLLVIFMITAPLMYNGIKLELPKTKRVHSLKLTADQLILSVSPSGEYFIGSKKYLLQELSKEISTKFEKTRNKILYLRAHYSLKYGKIAKLMSFLKSEGVSKIALVTETEK